MGLEDVLKIILTFMMFGLCSGSFSHLRGKSKIKEEKENKLSAMMEEEWKGNSNQRTELVTRSSSRGVKL